jgi:hypothetical protein
MRSIADDLKDEDRARLAAMTPAERVALALALAARDVDAFRRAHLPPLPRDEAIRMLQRLRQASRRPSRCLSELIG